MSTARKVFLSLTSVLSFLTTTLIATPSHAAVSVVLECSSSMHNIHSLYEVDYDARTVRVHAVDDDGLPSTESNGDHTYPAQITDREITWSEYELSNGSYRRDRLSRTSGKLTVQDEDTGGRVPDYLESNNTCQKYVPPPSHPIF